MEMKVGIELLVPGMQDGDESQFAAQSVFGVVAKTQQGLCYGLKEYVKDGFLIAENDGIKIVRKCEYRVKIADGQKLGFAGFKPSFARDVLTFGTVTISA